LPDHVVMEPIERNNKSTDAWRLTQKPRLGERIRFDLTIHVGTNSRLLIRIVAVERAEV
jgi:hypothetical protein